MTVLTMPVVPALSGRSTTRARARVACSRSPRSARRVGSAGPDSPYRVAERVVPVQLKTCRNRNLAPSRECELDGGICMEPRGGERRHGAIFIADEEFDFGAAEYDALGAPVHDTFDDLPVRSARLIADNAADELVVDHVMNHRPFRRSRHDDGESMAGHAVSVERFLHGESGAEDRDGAQAS